MTISIPMGFRDIIGFFSRIAVTINNIYDKKCLDFVENPEVGCTCFSI